MDIDGEDSQLSSSQVCRRAVLGMAWCSEIWAPAKDRIANILSADPCFSPEVPRRSPASMLKGIEISEKNERRSKRRTNPIPHSEGKQRIWERGNH